MTVRREIFRDAGVVAATTIGAGVFSLPWVIKEAGWVLGFAYLILLSMIIVACHMLYFAALRKVGDRHRLVGLVRTHLGSIAYYTSFIVIVVGLVFALVSYLILGGTFFTVILPSLDWSVAMVLFWFFASWPLFLSEARMLKIEVLGAFFLAALIGLVFFQAERPLQFLDYPMADFSKSMAPFGPMLFALAGWTAIEPIFDISRKRGNGLRRNPLAGIAIGTIISAALYAFFVFAVLGSPADIVPDTISGLAAWPRWVQIALASFGLFAIWTSYIPVAFEVLQSLERDTRVRHFPSMLVVLLGPLLLVLAGVNTFLVAVHWAGGVFLSLQYFFIALVAKKALGAQGVAAFALNLIAAVFLAAAIYEIFSFI